MIICGRCGNRMTVRYHSRRDTIVPTYVCQRKGISTATPTCASIPGDAVDRAVGALLLDTVTPLALEVALAVQTELEARASEADQLRQADVERARHATELARRRYLTVDPDNRLVAATLEADWNDTLRQLTAATDNYERHSATARCLTDDERACIAAIAADFPALWSDPRTPDRERKRMVRLLVDDVTLLRGDDIAMHVRFKAGQTTSLAVPTPLNAPDLRRTPAAVIAEIDRLLDDHTDANLAAALNDAGIISGTDRPFHAGIIRHLRIKYGLRPQEQRLRDRGLIGVNELAERLGVSATTIKTWHHEGRLIGQAFNDKGECLYEIPAITPFKKIGRPAKNPTVATNPGGAV
jgi:hypothetical protein